MNTHQTVATRWLHARLAIGFLAAFFAAQTGQAGVQIFDINPDTSNNSNANASSGGRVNGLAADPGNNQVYYAASEYGGLFKSTNGGASWARLNGHLPVVTWDVAVRPGNSNVVYATSWYDGRVNTRAGISVSGDGGGTWTRPASATPPATYNCAAARRTEPAAFGISIRPDAPDTVFVGTNCGVARTTDGGATWTFVDPTPGTTATDVWDVVAQAGGIVDVCGDDGHFRSTDNGANWTAGGAIPGGRCSIAASPDESYVIFIAAADNNVYESDNGGANWTNLGNQAPQGRIPFVVTNQRSDDAGTNRFDLWYSDTQLFRAACTTPNPAAQGGAARCPTAASWTNHQGGAHWDAGHLVFDTAVAVDACPRVYSTDGGAHTNTVNGSPGCHAPTWVRSNVGLHALWAWTMDGANRAGDANEDLYFGNQDNGTFGTTTAGTNPPTWTNPNCCDTFDVLADPAWALGTTCCFSAGRFNRLELAAPGYTGNAEINTYPAGTIPGFTFARRMARFGANSVALITSSGLNITTNITANPIVWTSLGGPAGANACGVWSSVNGGTTTFFLQSGQCTGAGNDTVWSYVGTAAGGTWNQIDNTDGLTGGFGVFGADPNNPNRLYASNLTAAGPRMVFSTDGGTTWDLDPELDTLMTAGGVFAYQNQRGPRTNRGGAGVVFSGYPQPSMVAYDPEDANIVAAGAIDAGVFLSTDSGANWMRLTDPINGDVHLPRPRYAYFDHEPAGTTNLYVGTQGRGVWRIQVRLPLANAGGPYTTVEGTNANLAGTGSDPDGSPLLFEWDLDNDGQFDDAVGQNPVFDRVGQDGVFTIRLRVTAGGASAIATTTVTVTNVAPTVSFASDAPKPENATVTINGTVTDPGWLDTLTATVDWGDGTPVEPLGGILENVRPDATLTFSKLHVYGDNGTFTVNVCGRDDDTTTCHGESVVVSNVNPTAQIDESAAISFNGVPTILAHAGQPVPFSARSQDPGSDDLRLRWKWDDGTADTVTDNLVNPPNPDPFPSPSIQPRDVTDAKSHTFGKACFYEVKFSSVDDDTGNGQDAINVVIVGNATQVRSAGYWQTNFGKVLGAPGKKDFDAPALLCYLKIAGYASTVFDEVRNASTLALAYGVLNVSQNGGTMTELFDRQLLAAWLNFANGAIGYGQLVDSNGDGTPDTAFSVVVGGAEAVRTNPASTSAQIEAQKIILERLNGVTP
jgi:hypothetical protein